jgi:uncharacterized SAM-binding protein YcdF (DUF218 family)
MLSEIKPFLNTIVFSPTLLLLTIAVGACLSSRNSKLGKFITLFSTSLLWIISTPVFSIWMFQNLLTQYNPTNIQELRKQGVQAIVVLGGGVEIGQPGGIQQLKPTALDRLRHGIELARHTNLPLIVTGGKGWGADSNLENEATVSVRVARDAFQYEVQLSESNSRDTKENAINSRTILSDIGVNKIALVTHSWHMPRSVNEFQKVGFEVTAAPMGFLNNTDIGPFSFFPNSVALNNFFIFFKELVGLIIHAQ